MFKDKDFTENEIYEKLLNDKLSVNLGYLYENIVAQCLAANGNELFYHTIMNTQSKHNYEIDFILAKKNKIVPLEVKSSGYKTHKSLDVFTEKYSNIKTVVFKSRQDAEEYLQAIKKTRRKNNFCGHFYSVLNPFG